MPAGIHEIYAIRYAHHDRPASANYIGGDPHDGSEPLDYFVWAIVGDDGVILVDTGFDEVMARKRDRAVLKPIAEGLKALDIAPESIKQVIVSHLHYDHTGNYDLFPNARYHLQDCEMAYATGRCMCHDLVRLPFEVEDVVAMVRKVFAGRVAFHDGDDQIAPGITIHKVGGHSRGLQCVRVETRRGPVVLASDTSHLYSHFRGRRVFPIVDSVPAVLEGYKLLERLAASGDHIIPGHDPLVLKHYPAARAGLDGWVARLDADPRAAG
ncbi:MAG: N-acyl homoserine lactonase family protein [Variibacter sp.]|nr:N-acyl homoserine lactonase family protein [Variibacter sp.]